MSLKEDAKFTGKCVAGFMAVMAGGAALAMGIDKGIDLCHDGFNAVTRQVAQIVPAPRTPQ